jgi:DNA-binding CsgD family transcriptional regulator/PAS domain-containing protein
MELYERKYGALNPLQHATLGQEVGEVRCISEYGLIGAFEGDPMYEEWVKPQGIFDIAELLVDRTIGFAGTLSFTRVEAEGVFTPEALERIRLIFPHVRRSLLISRVLKMHRRGERELASVIEGLAAGVLLLSEDGEVLRRNAATVEILSARALVSEAGRPVKFNTTSGPRALAEALDAAGAWPVIGQGVSIPLVDAEGVSYLAHVLALNPAAQTDLDLQAARFAVFVSPSQPDLNAALKTLSETYGLTAAESRVALALVEIGSTPRIAEALGVSVATVRSHQRQLFAKTGARRQTEVVNLLRGFVSPYG